MNLTVSKHRLSGNISVPGSKSHTIRAIALALAADGKSIIRSPLLSADTMASLHAAKVLGAEIERSENDSVWIVQGRNGHFRDPGNVVNLDNSGTGIKMFAALAACSPFSITFDGDESLRSRPMAPLLEALEQCNVKTNSDNGHCPFTLQGPIHGCPVVVNGKSSQYVSAMLIALPLAPGNSVLEVRNINEQPYIGITLDWLKRTGIRVEGSPDMTCFRIPGGQTYKPFDITIPADFSTATFPLAAAAVTGSALEIKNLDFNDPQGDKAVFGYLERMGVKVEKLGDITRVSRPGKLTAAELDLNATPDALPAVAAVAAFAEGTTVIRNVAQARIKETDRISCMAEELTKMGVSVTELPDGMTITGGPVHGAELNSHKDHRIVMALAVAGLGAEGETVIHDAEYADVTYPAFVRDFNWLGAGFKVAK